MENIPTTNPGCTTTVLGADNIANGSAALEPDFSANTINTTWYSNGTAMTVDSAYQTCTYDAPLTPPTPEDRPGYAFAGWKLYVPPCEIPSSLITTRGSSYGHKNDSTGEFGAYSDNTSAYNLTEDNTWGVTWGNGDKVTGEAFCSITNDGKSAGQTGNPGTVGGYAAGGQYCWCRATSYTANNAQQCSLSSPAWVFSLDGGSASNCADLCALVCASNVQTGSGFRAAVFTGLVAQ